MTVREFESSSPEETVRLGERLARCLRAGDVVGVDGELGAGKTCFVRGLARGLALDPEVVYSPSFTLVAEYPGPIPLFHVDLFRLGEPLELDEAEEIGLREHLDPEGVTAVEWASKLAVPPSTFSISVEIEGDERRVIRMRAGSSRGEEVLRRLSAE